MRAGRLLLIIGLCAAMASCAHPIKGCFNRPGACIAVAAGIAGGTYYLVKTGVIDGLPLPTP